jgi:hypothetical protein
LDSGAIKAIGALALGPDGRLYAIGAANYGSPPPAPDFLVVRLSPDGGLDRSFGTEGRVITDLGTPHERASALVILPDGRPVAGGYTTVSPREFVLVRYLAD